MFETTPYDRCEGTPEASCHITCTGPGKMSDVFIQTYVMLPGEGGGRGGRGNGGWRERGRGRGEREAEREREGERERGREETSVSGITQH